MPPGAKKRKAAKKKQEQASSSTQINLNSNNHDSRSQDERESDSSHGSYKKAGFTEEDAIRIEKEPELVTDERIEITDSSHDHDKSSSSSSSSSSDDESREVDNKETGESVSEVITVTTVPIQHVRVAGDAPFMGSTANVIVESTGLMDSTTPSDQNTEKVIEIAPVDTIISNEPVENYSLPKPNEITTEVSLASDETKQASSSTADSVKDNERKTSTLPESKGVPEGSKESEVVVSHEEEAPVRPTHRVAQRTSWFSCCGLFDVMTGSSR